MIQTSFSSLKAIWVIHFEGYMGNSIAVQKTFHYTVLSHVEYRAVVEVVRIVPAGSLFPSVAIHCQREREK